MRQYCDHSDPEPVCLKGGMDVSPEQVADRVSEASARTLDSEDPLRPEQREVSLRGRIAGGHHEQAKRPNEGLEVYKPSNRL